MISEAQINRIEETVLRTAEGVAGLHAHRADNTRRIDELAAKFDRHLDADAIAFITINRKLDALVVVPPESTARPLASLYTKLAALVAALTVLATAAAMRFGAL